MMKKMGKACLPIILLVLLPLSGIGSDTMSKFRAGFQTGGSVGLSSMFSQHSYGGHMTKDYNLDVHFGVFFQYDFDKRIGLQLNADYQHGSCPWTFFYYGWPESSGTDPFSLFFLNLNAVFNAKRGKILQFFFLAGGGLASGNKFDGLDAGFNLGGGPGLRLFLSPDSPTAVIFGATFHHMWDASYSGGGDEIIRFTAGLEFGRSGR